MSLGALWGAPGRPQAAGSSGSAIEQPRVFNSKMVTSCSLSLVRLFGRGLASDSTKRSVFPQSCIAYWALLASIKLQSQIHPCKGGPTNQKQ
jgi:hypothetical protein